MKVRRPKVKICVAFNRPGGHVLMQGTGNGEKLDTFKFWRQRTGRRIEKVKLPESFIKQHGREIGASFAAAIQTLIEHRHD